MKQYEYINRQEILLRSAQNTAVTRFTKVGRACSQTEVRLEQYTLQNPLKLSQREPPQEVEHHAEPTSIEYGQGRQRTKSNPGCDYDSISHPDTLSHPFLPC